MKVFLMAFCLLFFLSTPTPVTAGESVIMEVRKEAVGVTPETMKKTGENKADVVSKIIQKKGSGTMKTGAVNSIPAGKGKPWDWSLILTILAVLAAWTPTILIVAKRHSIQGKIISRYYCMDGNNTAFFLFKLAILSENKNFNLNKVGCEIELMNNDKLFSPAINMRKAIFALEKDNELSKSLITGNQFLNNFALLPADKNITGYLFFKFENYTDQKLKFTSFIFESFDNNIKKLTVDEKNIKASDLFFDDSIWEKITLPPHLMGKSLGGEDINNL